MLKTRKFKTEALYEENTADRISQLAKNNPVQNQTPTENIEKGGRKKEQPLTH